MLVGAVVILLGVYQAVGAMAGLYSTALERPLGETAPARDAGAAVDPLDEPGRISAEMMRGVIAGALGIPLMLAGMVIRARSRRRRTEAC
jgi:hypothetical protein